MRLRAWAVKGLLSLGLGANMEPGKAAAPARPSLRLVPNPKVNRGQISTFDIGADAASGQRDREGHDSAGLRRRQQAAHDSGSEPFIIPRALATDSF